MGKIKILCGLGCYWPGHERYGASGPIQSFDALVSALKDDFDFKVLAHDRQPGSEESVIKPDETGRWVQKDCVQVRYVKGWFSGHREIADVLRTTDYDLIVLNGFFDLGITLPILYLKFLGKIPDKPIVLSPRGEFSPGALELKSLKKRCYLMLNKALGLTKDVTLHATSEREAELFRSNNLPCKRIDIAHVISRYFDRPLVTDNWKTESLRLAFVGRISPMKNLDGALQILRRVKVPVQYDIYGPLEDLDFWARCEALMEELPEHVSATYKGPIANQDVPQTLGAYDLLFLPTHGENFGHVMHEALMSGTPCLISDQTPWRGLQQHNAGWDLPLDASEAFAAKIESVAAMTPAQRKAFKETARVYGEKRWREQEAIDETRVMYLEAARQVRKRGK